MAPRWHWPPGLVWVGMSMVRAGAASLFCLDVESAKMGKCEKNWFFWGFFFKHV